jgi:hypothetical protein
VDRLGTQIEGGKAFGVVFQVLSDSKEALSSLLTLVPSVYETT